MDTKRINWNFQWLFAVLIWRYISNYNLYFDFAIYLLKVCYVSLGRIILHFFSIRFYVHGKKHLVGLIKFLMKYERSKNFG